jgi:hypothetical protein
MKKPQVAGLLVAAFLGMAVVPPAHATICIAPKMKVRHVQGQVFWAYKGESFALEGATVTVLSTPDHEPLASLTTGADGVFSFESIAPGRYDLVVRHFAAVSLGVLAAARNRGNLTGGGHRGRAGAGAARRRCLSATRGCSFAAR